MIYTVPINELEKLEKKLNHIRNKGVDVTFKKGEPYKAPVYMEHPDPITHVVYRDHEPTYIKVVDVEVDGHYGIEGWEFVGTIEHKGENGNIIRVINDKFKVPEEFYHKGPACDHCHRIRDRKDTYLIRNTETGEYKQVGKTCLREYTGGLDADACAEWHTLDSWLMKLFNAEAHQYGGGGIGSSDLSYSGDLIKKIAYAMIREKGYKKASSGTGTAYEVEEAYVRPEKRPKQLGTDEEIKAIDEWIVKKEQDLKDAALVGDDNYFNNYLRNAIVAWKEKYPEYRDLPLIVSLINTYFKDIQEQARVQKNKEESTSEYLGEVGDTIEFTVTSYRLLFIKDNYYNGPSTRVYQLTDDKGNVIILETSTIDMSDYNEDQVQSNAGNVKGLKMKAKVKGHKEYKGVKQTVVNRAKLLGESMSAAEALRYLDD